jgi:hypothetical protein
MRRHNWTGPLAHPEAAAAVAPPAAPSKETPPPAAPAKDTPPPAAPPAAGAAGAEGTQGTKPGGKDGETPKPPEKYVLAIPKEAETWLDAADLSRIEREARASGWTNEEAQAEVEATAAAMRDLSTSFRTQTEADETYGGAHLAETQRLATSVIDKFAPAGTPLHDELRRELAKSGLGNKLTVVSFLARIGKAMAEDRPSGGGGGAGGDQKTVVSRLYDHPTSVALEQK